MATINKSDYWKDRAGAGKGDLPRPGEAKRRAALYWKRSACCNARLDRDVYPDRILCDACGRDCEVAPDRFGE